MSKYSKAYSSLRKNALFKIEHNPDFILLGHLVAKEKPRKVKTNIWRFYECPVCRGEIEEVLKYCPHCGQRIWCDRSDKDD